MEKEFIPYEQALALKELGFDEPCFGFYTSPNGLILEQPKGINGQFVYFAPLYQQAFRWFREKYNLSYWIETELFKDKDIYYVFHGIYNPFKDRNFLKGQREEYHTYEEAELACLRKLIEIVKQK